MALRDYDSAGGTAPGGTVAGGTARSEPDASDTAGTDPGTETERLQGKTGRTFGGFVDRMNRWLVPYIGPPPLGPYDEAPRPVASACPLCGKPMAEHEIDRGGPRTQLHCPA